MGILAMNMEHPENALVITFEPTGEVEALHIDQFDLGFLGAKSIQRATDIVFNEQTQRWDIYLIVDGNRRPRPEWRDAAGFATYEEARKVEVAWLNLCRLNEFSPMDSHGLVMLHQARKAIGLGCN